MTAALALGSLAIAVLAVVLVRLVSIRRQRRTAELARIREHPGDFVTVRAARLRLRLVRPRHRRAVSDRTLARADAAGAALRDPSWIGMRRILRIVCAVALPAMVGVGAVLNVEIFIALNGGAPTTAALLKGACASIVELAATMYVTELMCRRRPGELGWQIQLACILAFLAVVIGYVASYAPARSQQHWSATIAVDKLATVAATADDAAHPTANTAAGLTAARAKLATDTQRLHRAEQSDTAQAVALPVAEVLVGELALGGLVAGADLARRAALVLRTARARARSARQQRRIARRKARSDYLVVRRLRAAGVIEVAGVIAGSEPEPRSTLRHRPVALRHRASGRWPASTESAP